jgi:SAM-dependent methyltransferase
MSEADRDRWNARYREGAYADRPYPSALLVDWLPRLETTGVPARALDVACGAGRNALFLARAGWQVDALDISDVALDGLRAKAGQAGLDVRGLCCDLEPGGGEAVSLPEGGPYGLILVIRYTNPALLRRLPDMLAPGGHLIVELHLEWDGEVVGPKDPRFRVVPGELRAAAAGLEILHYAEGVVADPDGRRAALARLIARRPRPD